MREIKNKSLTKGFKSDEDLKMTDLINEIVRIDSKYQKGILYRMLKEDVYKIYRKVKRKEKQYEEKENS